MRISDWSSDVCSSDLLAGDTHPSVGARLFSGALAGGAQALGVETGIVVGAPADLVALDVDDPALVGRSGDALLDGWIFAGRDTVRHVWRGGRQGVVRSEEYPSELQSLMRISYAVFCLQKQTPTSALVLLI